jgi:hypothetical protein
MTTVYSHDKKKKLAQQISKIKNKEYLIKIYEIISENNTKFDENNNGLFTLFHKLSDDTYKKLDNYIKIIKSESKDDDPQSSENKNYDPYCASDFPAQDKLSPKLKYSNKEKGLLKRQRYDENINSDSKNNVIYCDFNTNTDSEKN